MTATDAVDGVGAGLVIEQVLIEADGNPPEALAEVAQHYGITILA